MSLGGGSISINDADYSITNEIQNVISNKGLQRDSSNNFGLKNCANGQVLKYNSGVWSCGNDIDTTIANTDTQDLSISGHTISLINGGSVTVPDNYAANTNAATICSGTNRYLDGNGNCDSGYLDSDGVDSVGDPSSSNEIQNVISNRGLERDSNNNFGLINTCATNQVLKWNGVNWVCSNDIDTNTDTDTKLQYSGEYSQSGTGTKSLGTHVVCILSGSVDRGVSRVYKSGSSWYLNVQEKSSSYHGPAYAICLD